jgi:hypothetical protein
MATLYTAFTALILQIQENSKDLIKLRSSQPAVAATSHFVLAKAYRPDDGHLLSDCCKAAQERGGRVLLDIYHLSYTHTYIIYHTRIHIHTHKRARTHTRTRTRTHARTHVHATI